MAVSNCRQVATAVAQRMCIYFLECFVLSINMDINIQLKKKIFHDSVGDVAFQKDDL